MPSPASTAAFCKAVRTFSLRVSSLGEALRYETKPDERHDITLIAERVYGNRSEYMAIFAAAGMDTLEQTLPEQTLVLPTRAQLQSIKRQTGYLTDEERRAYDALG